MKHIFKNHKLGKQYIRYLFSYLIILMIPLVILTYFYSQRFMRRFYSEIFKTVDSQLIQLGNQLDNEYISMEKIVGQLALNRTVRQASQASSPLQLTSALSYLSGFRVTNPFLQDIVLILDQQEFVITSTTTVSKKYYFDYILQIPEASQTDFQELLTASAPQCLAVDNLICKSQSSNAEDTILFSFPLFTDYQSREGTVLFFVSATSMNSMLTQMLQNYQAQIYIMDPSGTVISTAGPVPEAITEGSGQYITRSLSSKENHWICTACIPNRQDAFSQVSSIMKEFIAAIAAILLLASFSIYLLQKVNYRPVHNLFLKAKQILPEDGSSNEMLSISNALDYLTDQNTSLSSQLSGNLSAIINERLFRLLNGTYASRQDFNLDCSELDLYLPNGCFTVGIILLHKPVEHVDMLAEAIKEHFAVPYVYHYLHSLHPNQIVILVNIPDPSAPLKRYFDDTQDYLLKEHQIPSTIGIGTPTDRTDRIAQSYMEASSALDYRFVKGNGTVILFREILGSNQASVVYPHEDFGALQNALLSQNEQNIRDCIQNIITYMESNPMPIYLARSICFDLIHTVNKHYWKQKPEAANSPLNLSGMETAQEIIFLLHQWSEHLKTFAETTAQKAPIEDVLAYLSTNCLSCDFSAYESAEHFGMTLPAFSKFFKEATGQNVMDYTIHTRLEKAKELLISTDLALKDIAEQVGYYNVSSFTRRFKLNLGVTPGEYRKITLSNSKTS